MWVRKEVRGFDARDAQAAMESLRVIRDTGDGRVKLGYQWSEGFDEDWRSLVSFRVVYPRDLATSARTTNGDIRIRGARHRCQASSLSGSIHVQGAVAWLRVRSASGRVTVKLSTGGGRKAFLCDIETVRGSVDLVLDRRASARLTCSTRTGAVDCGLPMKKFSIHRRSVDGTLGAGRGSIKIRSASGGIRLRPRSLTL